MYCQNHGHAGLDEDGDGEDGAKLEIHQAHKRIQEPPWEAVMQTRGQDTPVNEAKETNEDCYT